MTTQALIHFPKKAKRGEVIEIRTMIAHVMETGFRRTQRGEPIPRNIITDFSCRYNGVEICRAQLHPAMTANPFLIFRTVATESGKLVFQWSGDNGFSAEETAAIEVE
jgi:sulfur-oxidizing protein SoxZ